jgi:hypothetical protein
MTTFLEWLASLLVVFGVFLMTAWPPDALAGPGDIIGFGSGVLLLTFGVRLTIDVARRDES